MTMTKMTKSTITKVKITLSLTFLTIIKTTKMTMMKVKFTLSKTVISTIIRMTMLLKMRMEMRMRITLPGTDSGGTNNESQAITTNTGDFYIADDNIYVAKLCTPMTSMNY